MSFWASVCLRGLPSRVALEDEDPTYRYKRTAKACAMAVREFYVAVSQISEMVLATPFPFPPEPPDEGGV